MLNPKLLSLFWSKVNKALETECWEWTASLNENGYGRFSSGERYGVPTKAHRASYWINRGPFDTSFKVLHICDNPKCVNPKHLRLGTQDDNLKDMMVKGRALKKLNLEDTKNIIIDSRPQRVIAKAYGVTKNTIASIQKRRRHI